MATTRSPNRSPDETADPTPLIGSSSDESNSGRRILRAPSLQQAARFLRQASGRRLMREPSMMVRETAAEQLEERQSDWAYSKPVVILDILWNFAFIVAAVAVLILSIDESPSSPLRLWISGYALQCVVHVVCVCFEFRRRMQVREQLVINGGNAVGGGSGGSGDLGFDSMDGSGQYVNLEQNGDDGSTSMAKHLESANTMFSFIWWVIGFYWVSADGQDLIHDSPNLYWLCIVFLGFDVLFVVFCIALACIIGIAVCCCLPCIIALLYAVADQFGSSDLRRVQISTKTVMMKKSKKVQWFWTWVIGSVLLRLILVYFPKNLNLSSRPEVSTPLTSIRRLAEGYWLKQSSMSPYAGSMYHGSPLLLTLLGPLTVTRIEGQPDHLLCSLLFVMADIVTAMLICATGKKLHAAYSSSLQLVGLHHLSEDSDVLPSGDFAALVYLWNPFTIVACVGLSTSAIENLMVLLTLYGACARLAPLAAFGWVMATHLSLYPAILIIPVILLFGYGPDAPPRKLFRQRKNPEVENSTTGDKSCLEDELINEKSMRSVFSWRPVVLFLFWALLWSSYVLFLCGIYVQQHGGLQEMFKRTYGFILTIQDLSPNIGVFWYFFAEVFDFFRSFFLIVFHGNILLMIVPLALRLNHRPCFLAFVYIVLASMLKSYPSVGDSALYLGLLGLFAYELKDMQFSFFLFSGYVGVSLLSPVMHNLWIWRGTGNANFYFATAIGYACLQIILVIESVSAMLNHDRMITKLSTAKLQNVKS